MTGPIPKVFHYVWLGEDPIPARYEDYRRTWERAHPDWQFRTWGPGDLDWLTNRWLFDRAPSYAQKADIARYEVVFRFGGVYLDTDMECLKPIDALIDGLSFFAGREINGAIGSAMFGAAPSHPILGEAVRRLPGSCFAFHRVDEQSGPRLLTEVSSKPCVESRNDVRIFRPEFFYPYNYDEPFRRNESFPTAYAVHHWSHSWKEAQPLSLSAWQLLAAVSRHPDMAYPGLAEAALGLRRRARSSFRSRMVQPLVSRARRLARAAAGGAGLPAVPYGDGLILAKGPLGVRVLFPTDDLSIGPELATEGVYDRGFVNFLCRSLRRGMTFVDVGANVGLFTLIAGRLVGPGGRVWSYECNPELVAVLRRNVALNWLDGQVTVLDVAAGRACGEAPFYKPTNMKMLGSTRQSLRGRTLLDGDEETTVGCETLDSRLGGVGFIDLVKIDVEGAEHDVLAGMAGLIHARQVGMLSLEYRADAIPDDETRVAMEKALSGMVEKLGATLYDGGSRKPLRLDEALVAVNFPQLVVRFPWSTIEVSP